MAKYRKKPVVIEAVQWTGENIAEIVNFLAGNVVGAIQHKRPFFIPTLEGVMTASVSDWIIQGVNGEFYACKPDIFEKTYESA